MAASDKGNLARSVPARGGPCSAVPRLSQGLADDALFDRLLASRSVSIGCHARLTAGRLSNLPFRKRRRAYRDATARGPLPVPVVPRHVQRQSTRLASGFVGAAQALCGIAQRSAGTVGHTRS